MAISKTTNKKYLAFVANVKEGKTEVLSLDSTEELPMVSPDEPEEVVTIGKVVVPVAEIYADLQEQIDYRVSCLPRGIGRTNLLFSMYLKDGKSRDNPFNSSHDDHYPLHCD